MIRKSSEIVVSSIFHFTCHSFCNDMSRLRSHHNRTKAWQSYMKSSDAACNHKFSGFLSFPDFIFPNFVFLEKYFPYFALDVCRTNQIKQGNEKNDIMRQIWSFYLNVKFRSHINQRGGPERPSRAIYSDQKMFLFSYNNFCALPICKISTFPQFDVP